MKYRNKYFVGGALGSLQSIFKDPKQLLNKGLGFADTLGKSMTQMTSLEDDRGVVGNIASGLLQKGAQNFVQSNIPGGGVITALGGAAAKALDNKTEYYDEIEGTTEVVDEDSKGENALQAALNLDIAGIFSAFGDSKYDPTNLKRRNKELAASKSQLAANEAANQRLQKRSMMEANQFNPFMAKQGGKFYFKKGGKWMDKVSKDIKKKGTEGKFTEWCKSQGYNKTTCSCVSKGKKSKDKTIVKRATLAGTFLKCK